VRTFTVAALINGFVLPFFPSKQRFKTIRAKICMLFMKAFMELKKMRADFTSELRAFLTIVEIDKGMRRGALRTLGVFRYPVLGISDINRF
jgi:hypothetical protein